VTFYDAHYIVLAAALGLSLVSTDGRPANAPELPGPVETLLTGPAGSGLVAPQVGDHGL
jgi:hypothetical protein